MQMQLGSMMLAVERGAGAAWRRGARGVILVQLFLWETKQWESSGDDARLRRLAVMLQGDEGELVAWVEKAAGVHEAWVLVFIRRGGKSRGHH
jgi:hypothetical protein